MPLTTETLSPQTMQALYLAGLIDDPPLVGPAEPDYDPPYLDEMGHAQVPCHAHPRYRYWQQGGQSLEQTRAELEAAGVAHRIPDHLRPR